MSVIYKTLDSFKLTGHLQTNFASSFSQDDRLFIISDIGLYILALKSNLTNPFARFSCQKHFIKPSNFTICDKVGIDLNQFVHELPKDMLYESVGRIELSQNLNNATSVEPSILCAQWSDATMVDGIDCMLAVLTNLYSLEIYVKYFDQSNMLHYNVVLNLTNEMIEHRRGSFVYSARLPPVQRMNELRKRVEYIAPTAFCWGHTFAVNNRTCTIMFLGNFQGAINIWRIYGIGPLETSAKCEFLGVYNTKLGRINSLYWHCTHEYGGGLCIGDYDGKISILQVKDLDKKECLMENEVAFYTEQDRKVDKITVMTFGEYIVLTAVKQCYLLFYGLSQSGKVFDFTVHNVDNFYVTGISHHENVLKILTFTGAFKELTLSVHFNKISVEEKPLKVKLDFTGLRAHGFLESANKIFIVMLLTPCRLKNSVRGKQFVYFYLLHNTKLEPLKLLLENKSGSLGTYWDCLETLRLLCLKEQRFPWLGLDPEMDYDDLSLLQLKTLRLIARISETVFTVVKTVVNYDIKPYILLHYLVDIKLIIQRLNTLFHEHNSGKELSKFELRSIDLQVFFLKEMVASGILPKSKVGKTFIDEIAHVLSIANEMTFPDMLQCHFCGEKLIGPICLPPHADSRCSLTMMPIFLAPAYRCAICSSLAHSEARKGGEVLFCPYCDIPMSKVCLDDKIKKKLDEFEIVVSENEVQSKCSSDCLIDSNDTIRDLLLNLEENDRDYVVFSDSGSDCDENKLKEVYYKIAKISFDEGSSDNHTQ